jgi:hypothetical protein
MNPTKSLCALKRNWLIIALIVSVVMVVLSLTAVPTRAGGAEDKAKKALAEWKAANQAVADAKEKLEEARKKLQTEMSAATGSKEKTPAQEKQLEDARAEVAAAEAALEKAEAALLAARVALEEAITELPDGELKDQLKRERNYPSLIAANGLYVVKFDTPAGQLTVNLPNDMRAGDTISGTVIAEPKGQTKEERAKNQTELNGLVIEIDRKPLRYSPPAIDVAEKGVMASFSISHTNEPRAMPTAASHPSPLPISLVNGAGKTLAETTVLIQPHLVAEDFVGTEVEYTAPLFNIPPLGQTGRPIVITGPFDGDSSNTTLTASALRTAMQDLKKGTENVSGRFVLLAESPRKAVFSSPDNVTGPIQITVNNGTKQTTGTYRNVSVNLSAPKTNLLKGEKTELKVEVSGLQGIKEPVPLTLESKGVITMEGGAYQPLVIKPAQVSADGRYSTNRGVTGVQAGGWAAMATVVTYSMDVKVEGQNCDRVVLFNSSTGDYTFNCPGCSHAYLSSEGTMTTREQFAVFSIAPIGKGTVTQNGCIVTLEHNTPGRKVMATIDRCTKTGMATVDVPADKAKFTITDRNITDNTCSSGPVRPFMLKPIYPNEQDMDGINSVEDLKKALDKQGLRKGDEPTCQRLMDTKVALCTRYKETSAGDTVGREYLEKKYQIVRQVLIDYLCGQEVPATLADCP